MKKINLSGVNETLYYLVLDNGLRVYLLPNNKLTNFYMTFNTRFGSLYTNFKVNGVDKKIPNGIAHFLEHITFKMKDLEDASTYFANLGSNSNAYTSYKITCYEVMSNTCFKENLEYLLDFVQEPFYTDENVKNEKGIICEEIKMYDDMPDSIMQNEINKSLFNNSNFKYKIAGECSDVNGTTLEDIELTYNTFYHPNNMFLVITGNFDYEEAIDIIRNNQSKKVFSNNNDIKINEVNESDEVVNSYKLLNEDVDVDKVSYSIKINKDLFKSLNLDDYVLDTYLSLILMVNFGSSSDLRDYLNNKGIISGYLGMRLECIDNHYIIGINGISNKREILIDKIREQFNNLCVSEEELKRKKKVLISNYIRMFDDIEETEYFIANNLIEYNRVIDNCLDLYKKLDYDVLNKIIKLIDTSNSSIVVMTKGNE